MREENMILRGLDPEGPAWKKPKRTIMQRNNNSVKKPKEAIGKRGHVCEGKTQNAYVG